VNPQVKIIEDNKRRHIIPKITAIIIKALFIHLFISILTSLLFNV